MELLNNKGLLASFSGIAEGTRIFDFGIFEFCWILAKQGHRVELVLLEELAELTSTKYT